MAKVRLEVNGRPYEMVAEDGQEARVAQLGEDLAKRVRTIVRHVGQVGEGRLILMAALQLADEHQVLADKVAQLEELTADSTASQAALEEARAYVAQIYGDLAEKFEALAAGLDGAPAAQELP